MSISLFLVVSKNTKKDVDVQLTVRNTIQYSVSIEGEYKRDPDMNLFNKKFTRKCRVMFDSFIDKLSRLPQTLLVQYNISVLKNIIIGYRMPNRNLINQVAAMVGDDHLCSVGYTRIMEHWKPYYKWENWAELVRKKFKRGFVFRSPLSVFDGRRFDYNCCDLSNLQERQLWLDHTMPYDGRMTYVDYVRVCKEEFSSERANLYYAEAQKRKFLFLQFADETDGVCPPLQCYDDKLDRFEDDPDYENENSVSGDDKVEDKENENENPPNTPDAERNDNNNYGQDDIDDYDAYEEEMERRRQIWDGDDL